jgi:hypothetical protein
MKECRVTLLTDGKSDRALIPPITWLLHEKLPTVPVRIEWADLSGLPRLPVGLAGRMHAALEYYPCDALLVHRDAETERREKRVAEIEQAVAELSTTKPHVCVITVRMQEAWMLIDETAIRTAAGNPRGTVALAIPRLQRLEDLPDPKNTLRELLRKASELTGRRLKKFSASASAHRVSELIDDWRPLRKLPAFVEFERELDQVLAALGDQE